MNLRRGELDSFEKISIVRDLGLQASECMGEALVSTVKSRPDYYELLGLKPAATDDAIAHAFARESSVLRPHAVGGIAKLCLAFETLRDPARRRAYDASLGLTAEPVRRSWSMAAQAKPYPEPAATYAVKTLSPMPEPRQGRQFVQSSPDHRPGPELIRRADAEARPRTQHPAASGLPRPLILDGRVSDEVGSVEWKRTGQLVGVLVAAAVFIGGLAGWWSGRDAAAAEQPKQVEAATPAPTKKVPSFAELWPGPSAPVKDARRDRPRRTVAARAKPQPPVTTQPAIAETEPQDAQLPQGQTDSVAVEQRVAEVPSGPAVTASLPLPDRTVARTIDRIGYSCGKVASTTAVEGASPGTYKVNCTSGRSYQAKPVNGRYRFRRWSRD